VDSVEAALAYLIAQVFQELALPAVRSGKARQLAWLAPGIGQL
jgi:hypothetical protein